VASSKKPGKSQPMPLLVCAAFCDHVLEADDGSMSAISLRDSVRIYRPEGADPETRFPISIWALFAFKSGDAVGERRLRLVLRMPTGKRRLLQEQMIPFNGGPAGTPEGGINIRLKVTLKLKTEGLYLVDVFVDRKRYTSMPLRVIFKPVKLPNSQGVQDVFVSS